MKILLIGGRGTIGSVVKKHFEPSHEIIVAGRSGGDVLVDISDSISIKKMFEELGTIDAVICIAGEAKWADFDSLTEDDYHQAFRSKLMGQVNVVRIGKAYIKAGGSFTLTTGILADDPVMHTTAAAMVNGGIHSFVKAVALEIKNGIRINVVAPGLVADAYEKYKAYFPGHTPVSMDKVALGYERSVMGGNHGEIIRIYN